MNNSEYLQRRPWSGHGAVPLSPSTSVPMAEFALSRYGELNVRIPGGNRLQKAREFLRLFIGSDDASLPPLDPNDAPLLRKIVDATQTCFEQYLVARGTGNGDSISETHRAKIEMSLSGAEIVDLDSNSAGRDAQFELFVGSILAMGGVSVAIAEPDLVFFYHSEEMGIAAKRVKSFKKLRTRFKDAVKQIQRSRSRGFVAINSDLLVRDLGLQGDATQRGTLFRERLNALERIDRVFDSEPMVAGRLVFGTDAIWHFGAETPVLEFSFFRSFWVYTQTDAEIAAADQFFNALNAQIEQRLSTLVRSPRV